MDWTLDDNGNDDVIDVAGLLGRWDELDDLMIDARDTEEAYNTAVAETAEIQASIDGLDDESDLALTHALEQAELTEAEALTDMQAAQDAFDEELRKEYALLTSIKDELSGYGGDYQFQGNWYPQSLIDSDYFTEYAEQMVKDIGDMPDEIPAYIAIDWEATAQNLKVDYNTVDVLGREYYYR